MAKIQLTTDNVKQLAKRNAIEINGETYAGHAKLAADYDEQGFTVTHILKRKSDGAFFSTDLYYVQYGHDNYEFEADLCEMEMTEVALVPVTITEWQTAE